MIAKINQLLQEVEALKAANAEELEALRIKYLSKKGRRTAARPCRRSGPSRPRDRRRTSCASTPRGSPPAAA